MAYFGRSRPHQTRLITQIRPSRSTTEEHYSVIIEKDLPCAMRDGVTLYADVYRPNAEGKFPVILMRTPYDKTNIALGMGNQLHPVHAAQRGYAVLIQDVRGMFSSGGTFDALTVEADDGYDTVQWAAKLPYSSGRVGMFGGSYTGVTQITAAAGAPAPLVAITPRHTTANYYRGWTYQDGAFLLGFNILWTITLSMGELASKDLRPEEKSRQKELLAEASDNFRELAARLPLEKTDVFCALGRASYFRDWLEHQSYDQYWRNIDFTRRFGEMKVAGLHFAGWYDIFLRGTIENYTGLTAKSSMPQKLVIGPWVHGTDFGSRIGEWDSGFKSQGSTFGVEAMQLRWFDHWLKGMDNGAEKGAPVMLYVMGENRWREEKEWPLARALSTKYYLRSGGHANTRNGDGFLSVEAPAEERPDAYVYDPMDPVPTRGGATTGTYPAALNDGVFDQRTIEDRDDVLVYSTPVLSDDREVTGPVTLTLFASTSEIDTDFTAKLADVHSDGYAAILCDGIIRGRYRTSFEKAEMLKPNSPTEFTIDLTATSNLFKKGHQIRLEVSSSNFPKFDRNLNTGADYAKDGKVNVASQKVFHDAVHPSCLVLPIVPRKT